MFGISNFMCLNQSEMLLQGDYYSESFTYGEFRLYKCSNRTGIECQSQDVIDQFFTGQTMSIAMINSYFDFNDYERRDLERPQEYKKEGVIKQYIDDRFFFELDPYRSKKANIFLMKSQAILQDDYLQLGQSETIDFVEIFNKHVYDSTINLESNQIISFFLRFDAQYNTYNRQIYSATAFLGDIGGLFSSLFSMGAIFISFINQRLFISAILKRLYQVKDFPKNDMQKRNKVKPSLQEHELQDTQDGSNLNKNMIKRVLMNMVNRKRFIYTGKDIVQFLVQCMCLRKRKFREWKIIEWDNGIKPELRTQLLFREGFYKLYEELDVISLLRSMRRVKLLTQSLLNQTQKLLLKFQRKNILESESSSGDSDSNNKLDTLCLMESTNPMLRLVVFSKIKHMINKYGAKNAKLSDVDHRLIRGLFVKHIREFDEEYREKMKKRSLVQRVRNLYHQKKISSDKQVLVKGQIQIGNEQSCNLLYSQLCLQFSIQYICWHIVQLKYCYAVVPLLMHRVTETLAGLQLVSPDLSKDNIDYDAQCEHQEVHSPRFGETKWEQMHSEIALQCESDCEFRNESQGVINLKQF